MKKIGCFLLCFFIMLAVWAPVSVFASDVKVLLNGSQIQFGDQQPEIIGNRTMVPLRGIFEALGCSVYFIQEDQTIVGVKDETKIFMRIGETAMLKFMIPVGAELGNLPDLGVNNTQETYLDVPPQIVNNRTLVPARAISDALGVTVDWNGNTATVTLTCQPEKLKQNTDTTFFDSFQKLVYGDPTSGTARGEIVFLNEEGKILLNRNDVQKAVAKQSAGAKSYYIELTLTAEGRKKLASATLELSKRTDGKNRMTIMLDDMILFTPRISGQIDSDIFDVGGVFTKSVAEELAARINQG